MPKNGSSNTICPLARDKGVGIGIGQFCGRGYVQGDVTMLGEEALKETCFSGLTRPGDGFGAYCTSSIISGGR